jgi:hypothetical protein
MCDTISITSDGKFKSGDRSVYLDRNGYAKNTCLTGNSVQYSTVKGLGLTICTKEIVVDCHVSSKDFLSSSILDNS